MLQKKHYQKWCFFCATILLMSSTPKYEEDNWMRFDGDHGTASPDDFEMEDDVDDLDIPSWANVTAEQ